LGIAKIRSREWVMERQTFSFNFKIRAWRKVLEPEFFFSPVVPRRRLKQFAINFPRAEGNGAGQGTERGVAEQEGYRKDLEQGFWKESIRDNANQSMAGNANENSSASISEQFASRYHRTVAGRLEVDDRGSEETNDSINRPSFGDN
ncbi:hypothetical protein ALC57_06206, partial [Trachymyrmex cornetzi]